MLRKLIISVRLTNDFCCWEMSCIPALPVVLLRSGLLLDLLQGCCALSKCPKPLAALLEKDATDTASDCSLPSLLSVTISTPSLSMIQHSFAQAVVIALWLIELVNG